MRNEEKFGALQDVLVQVFFNNVCPVQNFIKINKWFGDAFNPCA